MRRLAATLTLAAGLVFLPGCHAGDPFLTNASVVYTRGCETGGVIWQGQDQQGRYWGWASPIEHTVRDDPQYHDFLWRDTMAVFVPNEQEAAAKSLVAGTNYFISDGKRFEDSCLRP